MGAPGNGIAKLTITAFEDEGFGTKAQVDPNPIAVGINPETYDQDMQAAYTTEEGAGATGQSITFNRLKGQTLGLEFVFDGTGAVTDAPKVSDKPVFDRVADLRRLALDVNGKIHTPNFLMLVWGRLLFKGVMTGLGVTYTLFDSSGVPLRARVRTTFSGYHDNLRAAADQNKSSPDLTHAVEVRAGDTLPFLCHRVYGDSRWYVEVARHNGLEDLRRLSPGSTLLFPPLSGVGP